MPISILDLQTCLSCSFSIPMLQNLLIPELKTLNPNPAQVEGRSVSLESAAMLIDLETGLLAPGAPFILDLTATDLTGPAKPWTIPTV